MADTVSFDDLIPAKAAQPAAGDVSFDDLTPKKATRPAGTGDGSEARAYEPTWREQIGGFISDLFGNTAEGDRLATGAVGSSGLGHDRVSVSDFTPARIPMYAQETKRDVEQGQLGSAALDAIGVIPNPVAEGIIKGVAKAGQQAVEAIKPTVEAAERLGVPLPKGIGTRTAETLKQAPIPKVLGGNPVASSAENALAALDEAIQGVQGNAKSPMKAQQLIRDWIMSADDAAKAENLTAGRQIADAAPVAAKTEIAAPGLKSGADGAYRIVTPDQSMEIAAKPQIVELGDLKFADGALQPRDRSRVEYATEMLDRASRLDPEQLRASRVSDSGAPIVLPDGTILSGNGRARSIAHVYSNPALSERAAAYRESLGPEAANMKHPVMVMRSDAMTPEAAAKFADLSNRGRIASMSATERATRDAKALGSDGVSLYQGGDFEAPQNAAFLRQFMEGVVTASERPAVSKGGRLTQEGVQRMRNAVLAAAYDDAPMLSKMVESSDDNIRNLTGALSDAAPKFASLKADIAAGHVMPEMDATPQIVEAVKKIADLRNNGTTAERWFAQLDAFDETDPIVKEWVRAFHNADLSRPASRQQMAEVLNAYATEAAKHAPGGLFEDTTRAADVLNVARKATDESSGSAASAGAVERGQVAGNGASNAEGGAEALQRGADQSGSGAIQARGPTGDETGWPPGIPEAGKARDAGKGQTGNVSAYLPKAKAPHEIILDANKARLGAALGIKGEVLPSKVIPRVEELARSGSVDDVAALAKARGMMGDETWREVSGGVLARMGLADNPAAFAESWKAMKPNGRNALAAADVRQALDDLALVLEQAGPLKSLTQTPIRRIADSIAQRVPTVGPFISKVLGTKTGDAVAHALLAQMDGGITLGTSLAAKTLGKFVMRPQSTKALTRWLTAYKGLEAGSRQASTVFVLASRTLAKALADASGGDEREIADALQSAGGE